MAPPPTLRRHGHVVHRTAGDEERDDLCTAFFQVATIDPWGHPLQVDLRLILDDGVVLTAPPELKVWIRRFVDRTLAEARAEARGEAKGEARGETKGEAKALAELLGHLFARRIGRPPTAQETQTILDRSQAIGARQVEDALLDLDRDALVRWLSEPAPAKARKRKRAPAQKS